MSQFDFAVVSGVPKPILAKALKQAATDKHRADLVAVQQAFDQAASVARNSTFHDDYEQRLDECVAAVVAARQAFADAVAETRNILGAAEELDNDNPAEDA